MDDLKKKLIFLSSSNGVAEPKFKAYSLQVGFTGLLVRMEDDFEQLCANSDFKVVIRDFTLGLTEGDLKELRGNLSEFSWVDYYYDDPDFSRRPLSLQADAAIFSYNKYLDSVPLRALLLAYRDDRILYSEDYMGWAGLFREVVPASWRGVRDFFVTTLRYLSVRPLLERCSVGIGTTLSMLESIPFKDQAVERCAVWADGIHIAFHLHFGRFNGDLSVLEECVKRLRLIPALAFSVIQLSEAETNVTVYFRVTVSDSPVMDGDILIDGLRQLNLEPK